MAIFNIGKKINEIRRSFHMVKERRDYHPVSKIGKISSGMWWTAQISVLRSMESMVVWSKNVSMEFIFIVRYEY